MLQPKGKFDVAVFKDPTKEYRGGPFWGWNGKLDKQILAEQIDMLKEMGFGGFQFTPESVLPRSIWERNLWIV